MARPGQEHPAKSATAGGVRPALLDGVRLLAEMRYSFDDARRTAVARTHTAMLEAHWDWGRRLRTAVRRHPVAQRRERAASLIATLARALGRLYGRRVNAAGLGRMMRFAECYPVRGSWRRLEALSWGHILPLLELPQQSQRDFYAERCLAEAWSPSRLRHEIAGMLFERSAASRLQPQARAARAPGDFEWAPGAPARRALQGGPPGLPPEPELAAFLGLAAEGPRDARTALVRMLEDHFLAQEAGFCFVERFKLFQVGFEDRNLDLVLFHRPLKRLFAVELVGGPEKADTRNWMDFYLTWLDGHERLAGEQAPVGMVLDLTSADPGITLRALPGGGPALAWYQTGLPPRAQVVQFLAQAARAAAEQAGP